MENKIVPSKKVTDLTLNELNQFHEDIVGATCVYKEASGILEILATDVSSLNFWGSKYYTLSREVSDKLTSIKTKGILGQVE
jgi:hypothetical protein